MALPFGAGGLFVLHDKLEKKGLTLNTAWSHNLRGRLTKHVTKHQLTTGEEGPVAPTWDDFLRQKARLSEGATYDDLRQLVLWHQAKKGQIADSTPTASAYNSQLNELYRLMDDVIDQEQEIAPGLPSENFAEHIRRSCWFIHDTVELARRTVDLAAIRESQYDYGYYHRGDYAKKIKSLTHSTEEKMNTAKTAIERWRDFGNRDEKYAGVSFSNLLEGKIR